MRTDDEVLAEVFAKAGISKEEEAKIRAEAEEADIATVLKEDAEALMKLMDQDEVV
ncbi:MAG: hypothetical protein K8R11_06630 [Methanococcoides sp.]|nr:hypothetical protein [Methanococcoides sp.]